MLTVLRFLTAGESHGPSLTGILDGMPAGLRLSEDDIDVDLRRRQGGHGRSGRQVIEKDHIQLTGGVAGGATTGGPIALVIENRDWKNWQNRSVTAMTVPRPGHADLAGAIKYNHRDFRLVLERASARETAMRVASGAIAKRLLAEFGVVVASQVISIGEIDAEPGDLSNREVRDRVEASTVRAAGEDAGRAFIDRIDQARKARDTVGGICSIEAFGVPAGLGSHVQWDRKLDGRLAQAVMSIQAIKGVEIGAGFEGSRLPGSKLHDAILPSDPPTPDPAGWRRQGNNAGGLEGGVTNGQPVVVRMAMKPISTLLSGMPSVDMASGEATRAEYQRSDICAVPAAGVVGEAMVSLVLADAFLEKFGGDSLMETRRNYESSCRI
ncbi:MAG TPA: chorismate synthase [Chloroflexota bacterium]|nr:chorismate synthase [Chloroflexota bacterium]